MPSRAAPDFMALNQRIHNMLFAERIEEEALAKRGAAHG